MTAATKTEHLALNEFSEIHTITYLEIFPFTHLISYRSTGVKYLITKLADLLVYSFLFPLVCPFKRGIILTDFKQSGIVPLG